MTSSQKKSNKPTQRKKTTSKQTQSVKKTTTAKMTPEMARAYKIKYELKMISLVFFTMLSMIGLYTSVVGIVGDVIKSIYLGLFSYFGYIMPLFIFGYIFINLNPNMKSARLRVNIALTLLAFSGMLISSFLVYYGAARDQFLLIESPLGLVQMKAFYLNGLTHDSGGLIGSLFTLGVFKLIGPVGGYLLMFVMIVSAFIIWTRISLQDLWQNRRDELQSRRAEQRAYEEAVIAEKQKNIKENEAVKNHDKKAVRTEIDMTNEPHFLSKLDAMRKAKRNKNIKQFDYDTYEAIESNVKVNQPVEMVNGVAAKTTLYRGDEVNADSKLTKDASSSVVVNSSVDNIPKNRITFFSAEQTGDTTQAVTQSSLQSVNTDAENEVGKNIEQVKKIEPPKKIKEEDIEPETRQAVNDAIMDAQKKTYTAYQRPPLTLLNEIEAPIDADDKSEYIEKAKLLEETLNNFNVDAKVISVKKGPAITMFEVQPSPGVKVSKIVGLSDDIGLNLATSQVRIAPIPGKAAIGIEIPNKKTSMVTIKEVLSTPAFNNQKSKLTIGLGKDISGNPIIGDLASMPHLLIAGATGSGKSVCVNTIISSILFNATPDEVKFLMIDPKVVELSNYNGIPHLILPVVTDAKKASIALSWAVNEMTRRYKLFAETSVRDMKSYNQKAEGTEQEILPQIVVIIDELADLMMVAPNQVEDAICRLAQMARAAGIHLIVATQRPSVDVITGLIKANIPSRIAFSVSSSVDSRTIIDMGGAEKLLGKGDMLFYPVGAPKPKRAQGAFMSDDEVEKVVAFIKNQTEEVKYNESILDDIQSANSFSNDDVDEHLEDAIRKVIEAESASTSMLQRYYRIGYNRAARLMDSLEERGIIGPPNGSKPRDVLMTMAEFESLSQPNDTMVEETIESQVIDTEETNESNEVL